MHENYEKQLKALDKEKETKKKTDTKSRVNFAEWTIALNGPLCD